MSRAVDPLVHLGRQPVSLVERVQQRLVEPPGDAAARQRAHIAQRAAADVGQRERVGPHRAQAPSWAAHRARLRAARANRFPAPPAPAPAPPGCWAPRPAGPRPAPAPRSTPGRAAPAARQTGAGSPATSISTASSARATRGVNCNAQIANACNVAGSMGRGASSLGRALTGVRTRACSASRSMTINARRIARQVAWSQRAGQPQARRENALQTRGHAGQAQRGVQRRALALEHVHEQFPVQPGARQQPQRRGRRLLRRARRAANQHRRLAARRQHLQAPDLLRAHLRQPGDQRAAGVGLDQLLGAPEPLGRRLGLDPDQLLARSTPPAAARAHAAARGGPTSTTERPAAHTSRNTPPSKRHSNVPLCAVRISVRLWPGQPPPGKAASSASNPLGYTRATALPS